LDDICIFFIIGLIALPAVSAEELIGKFFHMFNNWFRWNTNMGLVKYVRG